MATAVGEAIESPLLTLYPFEAAPSSLQSLFNFHHAPWLAHIDASVANSIDAMLANWAMSFDVQERHDLPDGSVVLIGDFDLFITHHSPKTPDAGV